jgi:hypothetical protein
MPRSSSAATLTLYQNGREVDRAEIWGLRLVNASCIAVFTTTETVTTTATATKVVASTVTIEKIITTTVEKATTVTITETKVEEHTATVNPHGHGRRGG